VHSAPGQPPRLRKVCAVERGEAETSIDGAAHPPAREIAAAAISLAGVRKRFGEIVAVDGLDLEVPSGVCFGLLGPNGAGKSTTMRMLTAQTLADEGEIGVLGYELPRESKQARLEMGVVPQLDNLDVELTCRQILALFARLYRVPRGERDAAIDRALSIANLQPRADTIVRELSGGMRRRLLVARGLIHRPRLVLLDEPTVGLDPQVRQELWTLIDSLRAGGVTVLMSTHYIEEAERLADIVAVMSHGRVVAQGTPGELVRSHAGAEVLEVYGSPEELADATAQASRNGWQSRRSGPALAIMRAENLNGDGAPPHGVRRPANLEDAFVALTGEEIE
jgi:lipooligosaccharide transport system ATP-binding protein